MRGSSAVAMKQLILFVVFNSILPFTDVGSDAFTFYDLYQNEHPLWAFLTFYLMWNPFVLHLLSFVFHVIQAWWKEDDEYDWWGALISLALRIPFVTPIKNLHSAYCLWQLGYGTKRCKQWKKVEQIQREAGLIGMHESFMEAGPQSVVQLVTVFATGRMSTAQWISIPISIFSLAVGSAKVFFISRVQDESDPDPDFQMVFIRFVPWELLVVTNSTIFWTLIGGLLGKFVFIGIAFCFLCTLGALQGQEKRNKKTLGKNPERSFMFEAALTSLWVPSVVAHSKSNFYITASIASLASKVFVLLIAILLVETDTIDTKPILLWCKENQAISSNTYMPKETAEGPTTVIPIATIPQNVTEIFTKLNTTALPQIQNATGHPLTTINSATPQITLDSFQNTTGHPLTLINTATPQTRTENPLTFANTATLSNTTENPSTVINTATPQTITENPMSFANTETLSNTTGDPTTLLNIAPIPQNGTETFTTQVTTEHPTTTPIARNTSENPKAASTFCEIPAVRFRSCWSPNERGLNQKIRICGERQQEMYFKLVLFFLVLISTVLSGLSSHHLHKVSDYKMLYESTKTFLCWSSQPVVHRSMVFKLSQEDGDHVQLEEMLNACRPASTKDLNHIVNRTNYEGDTPLHHATKEGNIKCTEVLLKAGAIPKENADNKIPELGPLLNNEDIIKILMEAKQENLLSNFCLRALSNQTHQGERSEQAEALLSLQGNGDYIAKADLLLKNYAKDGDIRVYKDYNVKSGEVLEVSITEQYQKNGNCT